MKSRKLLLIFCFLLLTIGVYAAVVDFQNNFHAVIPGEVYRSGQFNDGEITSYVKEYGIRSVINLRGENTGMRWYDREIATSQRIGITHIDFRMSAKKVMSPEEATQLIEIMRNAPKPVLIHCNGGANRTSLASALYLAAITKRSEKDAEAQLSIRFGNLPWWLGSRSRMSESFEHLEPMLGYSGS